LSNGVLASNLLKSDDGQAFPVELVLKIVENVLRWRPVAIGGLMSLSKDFCSLLKKYEYSIIFRVVSKTQNYGYQILPSCISPESVRIRSMSYRWLFELSLRRKMTSSLIDHNIIGREIDGWRPWWPRRQLYRTAAFYLMYQLADCTVGLKWTPTIRAKQVDFLEQLDEVELATLGCFIKAMGMGYHRILAASNHSAGTSLMRECTCVFEDKLMRYGPFFAWAATTGPSETNSWFKSVVQSGLNELRDFEEGHNQAYSSLQSVLWLLFCKKANCPLAHRWETALNVIERDLALDMP